MTMATPKPELPRYLPEIPFPAYAYVPGLAPHPTSATGHLQGRSEPGGQSIEETGPTRDSAWLRGVDLFNHGYYWEAHEVWESSWKACGKQGLIADFLKALIKLAACGVKVREGRPIGITRHAAAARGLLESIAARHQGKGILGLTFGELLADCDQAAAVEVDATDVDVHPRRVFPFVLQPTLPA